MPKNSSGSKSLFSKIIIIVIIISAITAGIVFGSGMLKKGSEADTETAASAGSDTTTVYLITKACPEASSAFLDCTYDDNGNMTGLTMLYTNGTKVNSVYEYDENGYILTETRYIDGYLQKHYVYTNDEKGKCIEKKDTETSERYVYEYNTNGNCIKETFYSRDGSEGYSLVYEYDEKGNRISEASGNRRKTRKYDSNGNCIEKTEYNGDTEGSRYVLEYHFDEGYTDIELIKDGQVTQNITFEYITKELPAAQAEKVRKDQIMFIDFILS